jgi:hypothetical protein
MNTWLPWTLIVVGVGLAILGALHGLGNLMMANDRDGKIGLLIGLVVVVFGAAIAYWGFHLKR